jgi:hypothetical protein
MHSSTAQQHSSTAASSSRSQPATCLVPVPHTAPNMEEAVPATPELERHIPGDDTSLQVVPLALGLARARVYTFGACTASYSYDGVELLASRGDCKWDGTKGIAAGVPHCFPQFGPAEPERTCWTGGQHGFARDSTWTIGARSATSVTLVRARARARARERERERESHPPPYYAPHAALRIPALARKPMVMVELPVHWAPTGAHARQRAGGQATGLELPFPHRAYGLAARGGRCGCGAALCHHRPQPGARTTPHRTALRVGPSSAPSRKWRWDQGRAA